MKNKIVVIGLILGIFITSSLATASSYWPTNKYGRYDDENPSPLKYYQSPEKYQYGTKYYHYSKYDRQRDYYRPYYTNYYSTTRRIKYDFYERREKEFYDSQGNRHYDNYEKRISVHRY